MERHPMFMDQDINIVKISMLPKAKGITPPNVKLYYKIEVAQSCLTLCDPIACQVLASMGFSRQEYWSGLPFPSLKDLPNPGIEPGSLALKAYSSPADPQGKPIYFAKVKGDII